MEETWRSGGIRPAMLLAVVGVFLLAYLDLRREQARALDDFSSEQTMLAGSSAATVEARIAGVLRDLDAALTVADTDQAEPMLRRIVVAGGLYREADLLDPSGAAIVEVPVDPGHGIAGSEVLLGARAAAIAQLAHGDRVAISGPIRRGAASSGGERLRLFAGRSGRRAVVLVVDADRFFDGIAGAEAAGPAPARWLVVDDGGRWLEFPAVVSPEAVARWRAGDAGVPAEVAQLLGRMEAGHAGTVRLSRTAAAFLGLERRTAVAGFAPIRVGDRRRWSIAVVTSAMRVRDRARLAAWRLAAATGLAGLLVGLFGVVVARQDRREQRLAETLRLTAATAALRERSEKIVEAIPLGVLALDSDSRVTAANPYLVDRGVRPGDDLRRALPRASDDDIAALQVLVDEARTSRRPGGRIGLRMRLATDEQRDVDASAIPLGSPLPDADCFLVLHDRTEVRALERSLVRAEKLATIGTLAAGVAHEVGTPLGIISGRAEQLLPRVPEGESGEPMRKGLESILAQVDKVSTTIRQLLDFARARPIEAVAVTPNQVLESAAALLDHRFRRAGVKLTVDAPASVPTVAADPSQLEQVVVNLLMNACDACSTGGRVSALAAEQDGRIVLAITDDGGGIAPEHLASVLDPFFTTKKRGHGTGLGLTIAADVVRNHGGTLEIESVLGHGTTVRVLLPKARPIEGEGAA